MVPVMSFYERRLCGLYVLAGFADLGHEGWQCRKTCMWAVAWLPLRLVVLQV